MCILCRNSRHLQPLLLAGAIVCVLAAALASPALAQDEGGTPPEGEGPRSDVSRCAACHQDVIDDWQGGPHDNAYHDAVFQEGWDEQDNDPACLDCHTTGFSPATGQYTAEGVSCEACHGVVPNTHPSVPAQLNNASASCANCHTISQAEFRASLHEATGMSCTSCHYAHANGLRLDNELDQCLNCHAGQLEGFVAHETHIENGLTCRQCHGYVRVGQEIPPDGLVPTGHDFQEQIVACLDCHEAGVSVEPNPDGTPVGDRTAESELMAAVVTGRDAQLKATELEAIVQTLTLERGNDRALRLLQGMGGGLVLAGIVVFLLTRLKLRASLNGGDEDDSQ